MWQVKGKHDYMHNLTIKRSELSMRTLAIMLAISIVIIDQIVKYIITQSLTFSDIVNVLPGFDLVLRHNTGAAFNFLAAESGWQRWFFVIIAVLMSFAILFWLGLLKNSKRNTLEGLALGSILGGALGNLIDRVIHGYVIDFILLYYDHYSFPAFNIADSAISVGAFLLIIDILRKK